MERTGSPSSRRNFKNRTSRHTCYSAIRHDCSTWARVAPFLRGSPLLLSTLPSPMWNNHGGSRNSTYSWSRPIPVLPLLAGWHQVALAELKWSDVQGMPQATEGPYWILPMPIRRRFADSLFSEEMIVKTFMFRLTTRDSPAISWCVGSSSSLNRHIKISLSSNRLEAAGCPGDWKEKMFSTPPAKMLSFSVPRRYDCVVIPTLVLFENGKLKTPGKNNEWRSGK